jgi:hypothetical protein
VTAAHRSAPHRSARHISYYGQFNRVPDRLIGRRVWTILQRETLRIECRGDGVARYPIKTDYLEAFPQDS